MTSHTSVCVFWPLVMRGLAVKHALTSTSCPPNDIPSIPCCPVVLPLWTPLGGWKVLLGGLLD